MNGTARVPAAVTVVQRPLLGCRPCNRHVLSWQIPWRSPMRAGATLGALNIYATQPAIFDRDAIELARTFAGYAAVAIANARLYQATATLAEDMRRAMETRAVIEQAKGILVAQQHCIKIPGLRGQITMTSQDGGWRLLQRR